MTGGLLRRAAARNLRRAIAKEFMSSRDWAGAVAALRAALQSAQALWAAARAANRAVTDLVLTRSFGAEVASVSRARVLGSVACTSRATLLAGRQRMRGRLCRCAQRWWAGRQRSGGRRARADAAGSGTVLGSAACVSSAQSPASGWRAAHAQPDTAGVHSAGGQGASEPAGGARTQMQQDLALALVYSGAPDAVEEAHSLVQESLSTTTVRGAPPAHARPQRHSPGVTWVPVSQRLCCARCAAGAQTGCLCTVVRGLSVRAHTCAAASRPSFRA